MRRRDFIAATAMLLLVTATSPSVAQQPPQPFNPSSVTANSTVELLVQASKNKELAPGGTMPGIVQLKGYVGPSTAETVRLYWDLSLSRYWEIPRSAILQQVQGSDPKNDPVTLYVLPSTPIITANSMPAEAVVVQRALIDGLGRIPIEGPGMGPGRPTARGALSSSAADVALKTATIGCAGGIGAACAVVLGAGFAAIWQ